MVGRSLAVRREEAEDRTRSSPLRRYAWRSSRVESRGVSVMHDVSKRLEAPQAHTHKSNVFFIIICQASPCYRLSTADTNVFARFVKVVHSANGAKSNTFTSAAINTACTLNYVVKLLFLSLLSGFRLVSLLTGFLKLGNVEKIHAAPFTDGTVGYGVRWDRVPHRVRFCACEIGVLVPKPLKLRLTAV